MQRVKIVGTLGPTSSDPVMIRKLIDAGLDVVRLNFSHGDHETHRRTYEIVREQARAAGQHVAILADLCGPKIRAGKMEGGAVELVNGAPVIVTTEEVLGTCHRFSTIYTSLPGDVHPGSRILLDDGLLELQVVKVAGKDIYCEVVIGGTLKDKKGMNIPGTPLSTPALTDKDKDDLMFAKELGVDFFALSFVRDPKDVLEAQALAGDIPVIAKIEKPEAVLNLDAIVQAADGLMVARGDLGVEAGAEKVPLIQKRLIRAAGALGKPVIVATQMLDSMIHNPRPTRAEVSDVANAVLDGADAVMLSGETASGQYPLEAVKTMASIIDEVERSEFFEHMPRPMPLDECTFSNAIAHAAVGAAQTMELKAFAVYTESGHSAELVSSCRPMASIVAFSRHERVLRRLALRWGVLPLLADWVQGVAGVMEQAERKLLDNGIAKPGDDIAVTFGMQDMSGPGRTDVLKLWRMRG